MQLRSVAINYKKDFNSLKDLFTSPKRKKKREQNAEAVKEEDDEEQLTENIE